MRIKSLFNTTKEYFKKNPLIAFFAGSIVLLFVLVFITFLFQEKPSGEENSQDSTVPTNAYPSISPKTEIITGPPEPTISQPAEDFEKAWQYSPFEERDLRGFKYDKSFGSNGTIIYTFTSENPKRPNIMVVKEMVTVMQRTLMFDMTMNDVIDPFGKPDYIAEGSRFWGNDAAMYIYFQRGLAYTANMNTKKVFEQMEFMPVVPNEFKKTYGEDVLGDLKKY